VEKKGLKKAGISFLFSINGHESKINRLNSLFTAKDLQKIKRIFKKKVNLISF